MHDATMKDHPTIRAVFSLRTDLMRELKKTVPIRKRSAFVEEAVERQLERIRRKQGLEAMRRLREAYDPSKDEVTIPIVEWLRKDRRSH